MGGCAQPSQQASTSPNIEIATLNFSGICLSPFQYHDSSVAKDFMSVKFQQIMDSEINDPKYVWNVGKIDQKVQKERYAPVYNKDVGIGSDGKLMTKEQFISAWDSKFKTVKFSPNQQPNSSQINDARTFDWLCYLTFLNVVYNDIPKDKFNLETVKSRDVNKYKVFMGEWHSKTYLSNQKKMDQVVQVLKQRNLDILCLQQAVFKGSKTWESAVGPDYQVVKKQESQSIIIIRKKRFPQIKGDSVSSTQYSKVFNFNQDTVVAKRGKYLLLSGHLSSKQQKYTKQSKQMFDALQDFKKNNADIHVIMGLDSNHFFDKSASDMFNIVPEKENDVTTVKKRTAIQLQTKKTNLIVMENKDQIISDLKIKKFHVVMISGGKVSEKTYLPSDEHPFDHFLVYATIDDAKESKKVEVK